MSALESTTTLILSAGSYVESFIVADRHPNVLVSRHLETLIAASGMRIAPFDERQAGIARAAYRDFGKGSGHPAALDFGDCFSYALAIDTDQPLLFVGNDFSHTDVRIAAY